MNESAYITDDIYLAAFLILKGLDCSVKTSHGRGYFRLSGDEVNSLIQDYHTQDARFTPADFAQAIKRLRAELYAVKTINSNYRQ